MSENDDGINTIVVIDGVPTTLRYDFQSMSDIEQHMQLLSGGLTKTSFYKLLDWPYDIREMIVMLMHGINGGYRFEGIEKRLDYASTGKLLDKHFRGFKKTCKTPEQFKDAHEGFMMQICNAARASMGFPEVGKTAEVAKEPETPQ